VASILFWSSDYKEADSHHIVNKCTYLALSNELNKEQMAVLDENQKQCAVPLFSEVRFACTQ
jgi:hypothetical protein